MVLVKWLGAVALMAIPALCVVPFGASRRSLADRFSQRSAANTKNGKLGA